jgi:protoheme IX farnesyltransferase
MRPGRFWVRFNDYLELTKPRLSLMVILTTAVGFWLGMRSSSQIGWLLPVTLGTAFVVGGANALNQWLEREPDARMQRTWRRPIPSGRVAPSAAFRFGAGLSVVGIILLLSTSNELTVLLTAASWGLYVLVYTPMKRWTPLCTLVGAIPGALPPVIGWAGARGTLGLEAWALFFLLFVWQLPHFLSLALLYQDDYAKAGFPMLPLVATDGLVTARQIALYGVSLLPVSLFPTLAGVAGSVYFYGAMALSLGFLFVAMRAAWFQSRRSAQQLFRASIVYLPVLLGLLVFDRSPL